MKHAGITIGELAHPSPGSYKIGPFGSSLKKGELVKSGIAVAGIENVLPNNFVPTFRKFITPRKFKELADYQIRAGDILVTTMGTIGRAAVVPANLASVIIDSHLFRMRVDENKVYPPYLCFAINGYSGIQHQLNRMAHGAIMDGLNTTILKECTVPLPALDEQQRIAARLDKADRLRRTRRYARGLSDGFLQSVFLEMFGDPATNPYGWDTVELADLVQAFEGGVNFNPVSEDGPSSEWRVLKISSVTSGEFKPHESKAIASDTTFSDSLIVRKGDLIISRANTTELVGAVCMVRQTPPKVLLPDKLWRIRLLSTAAICADYLLHILQLGSTPGNRGHATASLARALARRCRARLMTLGGRERRSGGVTVTGGTR